MVNRSWACLTWCHIPHISDSSWLLARDFCWGIIEDGVEVSWGHLWRCYVDYDWFERAPFEGASVPSAVGAQTWKNSVSFHKIRVKWVQRDEVRVQDQSSENLLGIKPWLSVGVGLGRSLIGLSIGPLALEAHISNTSISLNGIEFVVRGQPEGIQGDYPHASSCTWPSPADSVWSCACTQCSHRTYTAYTWISCLWCCWITSLCTPSVPV